MKDLTKKTGIIAILIGIGGFIATVLFSSPLYLRSPGGIETIIQREIVLKEGIYRSEGYARPHYEGRITIPVKYPIFVCVITLLTGIGMVILSNGNDAA